MDEGELIRSRRLAPPKGRSFWVFGYGSLMWRPDFPFREATPALLRGYHRAFCIWSFHYRGSAERPGLVLGLDRGGACRGRVYLVAAEAGSAVSEYLHEREMTTGVYETRWLPVEIPGRRVIAAAYVADRTHPQFTGKLAPERLVELVLQGVGEMGSCLDYLESTVRHLDELGIADCPIHRLHRLVESRASRG